MARLVEPVSLSTKGDFPSGRIRVLGLDIRKGNTDEEQVDEVSPNSIVKGAHDPVPSGVTSQSMAPSYQDRLVKYIPGEFIALYLLYLNVREYPVARALSLPASTHWLYLAMFFVLLICLGYYLYHSSNDSAGRWQQIGICLFAAIVWSYSIGGGPWTAIHGLTEVNPAVDLVKALAAPIFTFVAPAYQPKTL